jgi:bile acid-coenzyme A ligase
MHIPIADVPRWYAERKPKDAVAVSHGADTLSWDGLERGTNGAPAPLGGLAQSMLML